MICNHFVDSMYARLAADELGLAVFSPEDIFDVNFRHDMKEGDYFLQYRRAGWVGDRWTTPEYSESALLRLPAILQAHDLMSPYIGAQPPRSNSPEAFRIFRVTEVFNKNDYRTYVRAASVYSTPQHWSFGARRSSYHTGWRDEGYMKPYGRWHLPVERKLTFCMDNERVRPHHGVIGKFDIEKLSEHLSETSKEPSFYALFRALISNEPTRPSVVRAVKEAKDNIDLEEVVS